MSKLTHPEGVSLTAREEEIVRLLADDLPYSVIAARLGISPKTVEYHVSNALAKTGCRTRVGLAVKYATGGLTSAPTSS